jgi:putative endonuclease
MYYTYVLLSKADKNLYTGYTSDLKTRLVEHNNGHVPSTKSRIPLVLIYYEACANQKDALRREKYLKSGNGKIYIKNRLRYFWSNGTA